MVRVFPWPVILPPMESSASCGRNGGTSVCEIYGDLVWLPHAAASRNDGVLAKQALRDHSILPIIQLIPGPSTTAASTSTACQKHSSRPVTGARRQPQTRARRGAREIVAKGRAG